MSAEQLSREEVIAFLGGQLGTPKELEALSGGAWSSAWAYRAGGEELVVRFGPDLPVPQVREVGATPSGRAYAISVRHHGRFLEDTPVIWHQGAASVGSWREFLLNGLVDDPGKLVHGWSAALPGPR